MQFSDETYQTSKEKGQVYKNFLTCLKERSLEKMTQTAYNHYHLYCGFIAHYDIQGFRATYSGYEFLTWLQVFAEPNYTWGPERSDLNRALFAAAQAEAPAIVREFKNRRLNAKIELLKALADELGYKVVPKHAHEDTAEATLYGMEDSGQLKLLG